jgi:hypothetical protein
VWFLTSLSLCAARAFYEGTLRRALFFLGILVVMRLILLGMLAFAASLPPGSPWPTTEADTLAGAKLRLPDAAKGKPALIVMTFSKDAGTVSKAWTTRFLKDFPPSQLYQIAMLEKAPRFVRGIIRSGMRGDMAATLHSRMLLLYQGDAAWRSRLAITNVDLPYLAVLDAEGRVKWSHQGKFDENEYQKLRQNAV